MVKRQNRVNDPASNAPRESQRQKGETPNSRISGPDSLGWERWTSCTLPHSSRAHRAAACMLYGPLIQHLQMLIEVAGRKRKAQTKTTYGLQSAAGYGRIHAEPWMTAGKTARAPGTPQHQAASECDLFAPQWVGPEMGSRSGGIWEAKASKTGSPDRTTDHTPMRTKSRPITAHLHATNLKQRWPLPTQ